jgi:MFS family permease
VLGLVNLIWGVGAVIGPVVGAAVATHAGDRATYALLAGLSVLAGLAVGLPGASRRRAASL